MDKSGIDPLGVVGQDLVLPRNEYAEKLDQPSVNKIIKKIY